jgi:hypothetical protein
MKCPYCERPLRALSIKCRLCKRFVPRWPHLFFLGLLAVGILAGIVILLEILAKSSH